MDWARSQGVHPKTAYRWWREETLPAPARQDERTDDLGASTGCRVCAGCRLYARVSSHDQRVDLDRQVAWLTAVLSRDEGRLAR